jgi:hypothetical protein
MTYLRFKYFVQVAHRTQGNTVFVFAHILQRLFQRLQRNGQVEEMLRVSMLEGAWGFHALPRRTSLQ